MKTNKEGLTFSEWLNAAGWPIGAVKPRSIASLSAAFAAWAAGEDPTEYRVKP